MTNFQLSAYFNLNPSPAQAAAEVCTVDPGVVYVHQVSWRRPFLLRIHRHYVVPYFSAFALAFRVVSRAHMHHGIFITCIFSRGIYGVEVDSLFSKPFVNTKRMYFRYDTRQLIEIYTNLLLELVFHNDLPR